MRVSLTVADARRLAQEGYGWNDLVVILGMGEGEARYIVLGRQSYMAWKARQEERKAS
jgi:hypothetical protein